MRRHAGLCALATLALGLLTGCSKLRWLFAKPEEGAASSAATLDPDLEGEITARVTVKGKPAPPVELVVALKRPRYRVDASPTGGAGRQTTTIFDTTAQKGWMINAAQRSVVVVDLTKMKPPGPRPGSAGGPIEPKTEATGKRDVVAGFSCEVWTVSAGARKAELCVTEGETWLDVNSLGWSSPGLALAGAMSGKRRFPLRAIAFDASGAEESRLEVTKVEKKSLEDARFEVPSDYRVIDTMRLAGLAAEGAGARRSLGALTGPDGGFGLRLDAGAAPPP